MLFSIDDKQMSGIPRSRREQYNAWRSNISDGNYNSIVDSINDYVDNHDYFTSSFIPKAIWGDEPCRPLLDACYQNEEHAGFFFGLIVWLTIIHHPEEWVFKLADKDTDDIFGTTYWKRNR